jgi:prophage maintenance system killer protein
VDTLTRITSVDLADSALHAPGASWAGKDFYQAFIDKAAVLVVRVAKNHALPDGNKRVAWVALRLFIESNGWAWRNYPSADGCVNSNWPHPDGLKWPHPRDVLQ